MRAENVTGVPVRLKPDTPGLRTMERRRSLRSLAIVAEHPADSPAGMDTPSGASYVLVRIGQPAARSSTATFALIGARYATVARRGADSPKRFTRSRGCATDSEGISRAAGLAFERREVGGPQPRRPGRVAGAGDGPPGERTTGPRGPGCGCSRGRNAGPWVRADTGRRSARRCREGRDRSPLTAILPVCSTPSSVTSCSSRRDGRVVEGGGLENRCGGNLTGGSNPSLSASLSASRRTGSRGRLGGRSAGPDLGLSGGGALT